jgi:predicted SAM-dependent methyltransferase
VNPVKLEIELFFDALDFTLPKAIKELCKKRVVFWGYHPLLEQLDLPDCYLIVDQRAGELGGKNTPNISNILPEDFGPDHIIVLSRTHFTSIVNGLKESLKTVVYYPELTELLPFFNVTRRANGDFDFQRKPDTFPSKIVHLNENINLGGGEFVFPDYVNLDWNMKADIVHNLKYPLPLGKDSVKNLFSSHVLEYFDYQEAKTLLRECHRVLHPEGVFRVSVPDFDIFANAYVKKDEEFLAQKVGEGANQKDRWPGVALSDRVMEVAYGCNGHRYFYSFESLKAQLLDSGFSKVVRCEFKKGLLKHLDLLDNRPEHSLFLEAFK